MRLGPFLQRHAVDALVVILAALWQAEIWIDGATFAVVAAALLGTLPLLLRRRFPFAAAVLVFAGLAGMSLADPAAAADGMILTTSSLPSIALAFWFAGAHERKEQAIAGTAIGLASVMRRWSFDPTITVDADIKDDKGRTVIARGTRVNPLDTVPLRAPLVFLDGDDQRQIDWALARYGRTPAKLILVGGAPLELMKAKQRRFYFDQGGKLTEHFSIRAVPAVVEQQGRQLLVTEQPPTLPSARPS